MLPRLLCLLAVASAAFAGESDRPAQPRSHPPEADQQEQVFEFTEPHDECETIEARTRDWLLRHGDDGRIDPVRMRELVRADYEKASAAARSGVHPLSIGGTAWASIGPTNIAGRVSSISAHPTVAGTFYVGTASGGVWKTTDSGVTWAPLTESLANLTVGAVAVAPSAPATVYLGTGEYVGTGIPGIGFLSSPDSGVSWSFPGTGVLATSFSALSVHPTNALDVLAGTSAGGFRSTNTGGLWLWTPWVVPMGVAGSSIAAIVRDPANANNAYASVYGAGPIRVLKSVDGGSNWTDFSGGLPTSGSLRFSLAIDSTGTVLYAGADISGAAHVYKYSAGTWADTAAVSPSYLYFGQSVYNNVIIVKPSDSNTVVVCGSLCSKSTSGGSLWSSFTGPNQSMHVDVHALAYDAAGTLLIGTDGGVYTTPDLGTTITSRATGMVTSQFYGIAIDRANPTRVFGGMQDNGSARRPSATTSWDFMVSSDGQGASVHAANPSVVWLSNQAYSGGNYLWRTKDAGGAGTPLFVLIPPIFPTGEVLPFRTQYANDPDNASIIYTNTQRLWRSTTGGDAWAPLPITTTDSSTWTTNQLVQAIAIAHGTPTTIMVAKTYDIFRSTDGGSTWRKTVSGIPANRYVTGLEIDPANANLVYATFSTTLGDSVYYSTNGGQSWTSRSTGLPNFSSQVIRVDPTDSQTLYCGTDVGVYRSTNGGANWSLFGTGLPRVAVYDLRIAEDGTILRAGTHGRGTWELQIPASTNGAPVVNITSPATSTVTAGVPVPFTGTVSDPNGDPFSATWTFPDTWERKTTPNAASPTVSHTFTRAGIWPVTLSATDALHATSASTVVITVMESGDTCGSPVVIPAAGPFPETITANTETWSGLFDATDPAPSCNGFFTPYHTGWFTFTAPSAGTYVFSTCGSTFNTILTAYTGTCGSLTEVAGGCGLAVDPNGTSGCPNGGSKISITITTAGQTVRLLVAGYYYYSGQGMMNLTVSNSGSTAPTVTRVATVAGPSTGGTAVTLYGSGFVAGSTVTFGATAATGVSFLTPNVLTATTPAHSAGVVDIAVTNPGPLTGRLLSNFTYQTCTITLSSSSLTVGTASGSGTFNVTASPGCGWSAQSSATWLTTDSTGIDNGTVSYSYSANTLTTSRLATISVGNHTFTLTQNGVLPTNLVATATSTTSVSVTWTSSSVDHFEVWRNSGAGYGASPVASPTGTSYVDSGRAPGVAYVYKVRAVDSAAASSAYTTPDIATTILFADDPLVVKGTIIQAIHLTELRQAVDAARLTTAVLGPGSYTDLSPAGVIISAVHINELQLALTAARNSLLLPVITFTPVSTGDTVSASAITVLRSGVK